MRAAYRQDNTISRTALFVAAMPSILIELSTVLAASAYKEHLKKNFIQAAIVEYPHIEGVWNYSWIGHQYVPALGGGTPSEYAHTVLQYPAAEASVPTAALSN